MPLLFVAVLASSLPLQASDSCSLKMPLHAGALRSLSTIGTVILHHTAISSVGGSIAVLRQRGLSYHYLITPEGRLIAGVPLNRTALHAAGANRRSVGISFVGGTTPDWLPTEPQVNAARRLIVQFARSLPNIRYIVGHGDVRDTNQGEPFGVDIPKLVTELSLQEHVELRHPTFEQEPLRTFRRSALTLQARPLTPRRRIPAAALPAAEIVICPGEVLEYPVPDVLRSSRQ